MGKYPDGGPVQLVWAAYHFVLDDVPVGDLTVESQDVLESRPDGDLLWVSGHVLGRRFSGKFDQISQNLRISAPVFGTYHWTFSGQLTWLGSRAICAGDDYYLLRGEYDVFRIRIRVLDQGSGETDSIYKGTWSAWTCYSAWGP
jgi:hypothetical protein